MRLLTGFFPPSAGRILVDGKDLFKSSRQVRQRIGYLPEHNPLYRDMTVRDFLSYVASLKGIPSCDRKKKLTQIAKQCGITMVLDRLIGKLSKGYEQRIGLAQALTGNPDFLILDEPTSGLDPQQVSQIRSLIQNLGRDRTILLSSHILPEVQMTCRRVLIMNEGCLVASGTPQDLGERLGLGSSERNLEEIFLKIVQSPAPGQGTPPC
jgi:ABC-2 type transport system ATP-binding protein